MALTPSTMLPLGTPLPAFSLVDCFGKPHNSSDYIGKTNNTQPMSGKEQFTPLLVAFICNHCPYVKHLADHFSQFARHYSKFGLQVIAINSNDYRAYPDDSPDKMCEEVALRGYTFPYLVDETQLVARAFEAVCTPDFFLFNRQGTLAYRGQYDDSRPGNNIAVSGRDMRAACDAVLANSDPTLDQTASIGCNIKWRAD